MIRLLLADGHEEYRRRLFVDLSRQEDFELINPGKDGYEAIRLAENFRPDIALLDVGLPPVNGIATADILKGKFPTISVILLSTLDKDGDVPNTLNSHIAGYLDKAAGEELSSVMIRAVYHGCRVITPEFADHFGAMMSKNRLPQIAKDPPELKKDNVPAIISRTEMVIMSHVGRGLSTREIAKRLNLREGTVRNYISSTLQKIGLHDRTQLAIYILQHGLLF